MTRIDIDLPNDEKEESLAENPLVKKPKKKIKLISKIIIYLLVIFVISGITFGFNVITSGENLAKTLGNIGLWSQIKHLISSEDKKLNGEDQDRINILLLGIGGR